MDQWLSAVRLGVFLVMTVQIRLNAFFYTSYVYTAKNAFWRQIGISVLVFMLEGFF
jgi:hypothetical protein